MYPPDILPHKKEGIIIKAAVLLQNVSLVSLQRVGHIEESLMPMPLVGE
jgi:hypothetical protein